MGRCGLAQVMMTRYVAFLRAINVGGHTVKMDVLRSLFAELGFSQVATFIASGNVIFESRAADAQVLEEQIAQRLERALGYAVATFVRSAAELAAIARYEPFTPAERAGATLLIAFLPHPPDVQASQRVLALRTEIDDLHLYGREVYWLCRTRMSESVLSGAVLEKALALPATMRNSTTVYKLAARYACDV